MNPPRKFYRLLLTGAAGGLGSVLRERMRPLATVLRVSDVADLGPAREGEEVVQCDLGDRAGVHALLDGVDAVLHFGGISVEAAFDPILNANIAGVFNLYEAARKHGVRRVVYASSNHVTGFYRQDQRLDADAPMRPDSLYGVSKCFGESLSRFYFDRHGIETVCVRIGSSFPEPRDRRMLVTWLSYDDLVRLVTQSLLVPGVGHTIVFGASRNADSWWDNRLAAHLGFDPTDSSEVFRARVEERGPPPEPGDPVCTYQGGAFVAAGPFDD